MERRIRIAHSAPAPRPPGHRPAGAIERLLRAGARRSAPGRPPAAEMEGAAEGALVGAFLGLPAGAAIGATMLGATGLAGKVAAGLTVSLVGLPAGLVLGAAGGVGWFLARDTVHAACTSGAARLQSRRAPPPPKP